MWILYYTGIYLFVFGIRVSALWNEKSLLWIRGRKKWKESLDLLSPKTHTRIWFHVSSLGEFEQARPVIEAIKRRDVETDIFLTFFSPSGYTIRKDYPHAYVTYLPADLPGVAEYWIKKTNPDIGIFVKYDLWPGYMQALAKNLIPAILISAHWKPGRLFQSWSLPVTKSLLKNFKQIFLQRSEYQKYFRNMGFHNISIAGDTRIDRSLKLPLEADGKIPDMLKDLPSFDLIAGSTWPEDEKLLLELINTGKYRVIIAPHDVSFSRISDLCSGIKIPFQKLSEIGDTIPKEKVIIIDCIGLLAFIYQLGSIAYIGGGFGKGIHNILEPMAYGMPVIFGPRYQRFPEAVEMIELGVAFTVRTHQELNEVMLKLRDPSVLKSTGEISQTYLQRHQGASNLITDFIMDSIPFPSHS
ncbi:MAG: 3-deoxy-D-manno-octulosonic acid transferase [Bacteroidota bacterium]|nr:3-deoxy-D-manno-octulosonic acid transferase [Bacteroidota bacterium]